MLVYAFREDAPEHARYQAWLSAAVASEAPFGIADIVLSGFLRVVTHPRVFAPPTPIDAALGFVEALRGRANAVVIAPGSRHWGIVAQLCAEVGAKGNLVPDAYLAALAIESGSDWITTDRHYARFGALRWRHPLDGL